MGVWLKAVFCFTYGLYVRYARLSSISDLFEIADWNTHTKPIQACLPERGYDLRGTGTYSLDLFK